MMAALGAELQLHFVKYSYSAIKLIALEWCIVAVHCCSALCSAVCSVIHNNAYSAVWRRE